MPRGGARPGAGRPKGSRDALPRGVVSILRLRVPPDATPEAAALADEALNAVADVMRNDWKVQGAAQKLAAAQHVREEICGPVPKRSEITGANGGPLEFTVKEI